MKTLTANQTSSVSGAGTHLTNTSSLLLSMGFLLTGLAGKLNHTETCQNPDSQYNFSRPGDVPMLAGIALTGAGALGLYLSGYEDGNNKNSPFLNNIFDNRTIQVAF